MMRGRRLPLFLLLAACIVVGGAFAFRGQWLAQLTGGGAGDTPAEGYFVQLTEPPLLAREHVAQEYRALGLADRQRRVLVAKAAGRETPAQSSTIRSLDLQIANGTETLQSVMAPERVKILAQQQSVRDDVHALLASDGVLSVTSLKMPQPERTYSMAFNGFFLPVRRLTTAQIESIERVPGVQKIFPNFRLRASLDTSVPAINAPLVWGMNASGGTCVAGSEECITGRGIRIGIVDSGVDYTHADLGGCTAPGPDCKVKWGFNYVYGYTNPGDPMDDYGHGTHVSATAAGKAGSSTGLNGVAPDADIYAFKVLDSNGHGEAYGLYAALDDLLAASPRVDVVNMSFGNCAMHDPNGPLSAIADSIVAAGITVAAAAGNSWSGEGCDGWLVIEPGAAWNVITVGGSDDAGAWQEPYSRHGPAGYTAGAVVKPDVLAPGTICAAKSILSSFATYCDVTHVSLFGTSMAAPHVAGLAALMLQAHPGMMPDVLKQTMRDSTFGSRNFQMGMLETSGYGMVDALATVFASPRHPVVLSVLGTGQSGIVPMSGIIVESNMMDVPGCASFRLLLSASDGSGCPQGVMLSQGACRSGMLVSLEPDTLWKNDVYFTLALEVTDTSGLISRDATEFYTTDSQNSSAPPCFSSSSSRSSSRSSSLPSSSLSSFSLSSSSLSSSLSSSVPASSSSAASSNSSVASSSSSIASSSLASSSSPLASSSVPPWIPCPAGYQCTRAQSSLGGVLQCFASSVLACTPEWNGTCGIPSCSGECYRCLSSSSAAPSSALSSSSSSSSSSRSSVASSGPHTCGNGVTEPTEQCDDGNRTSGDGCSSTCQAECIDTDSGPDYYVKGTTRSTWRSNPQAPLRWTLRTDSCQGNILTEFLCSVAPGTQNAIAGRAVTCKKGCVNSSSPGACVR